MGIIVVAGSINMDLVSRVKQFPQPGETIHSTEVAYHPGGKGANQAVAAARTGASTIMIGAVGNDAFGAPLINSLSGYGVNSEAVTVVPSTSGLAFITVTESGENNIILSQGANGQLQWDEVERQLDRLLDIEAILLQNEIPWAVNRAIIAYASSKGISIFYNPAPAAAVPTDVLPQVHTIFLNETETETVTGIAPTTDSQREEAARQLLSQGVQAVIITLGSDGCYYHDQSGKSFAMPAFSVKPVDTTAAGDTFIGAYASARCSGETPEASIQFAAAAAAIAVTRDGAQTSVPDRDEVLAFLQERAR